MLPDLRGLMITFDKYIDEYPKGLDESIEDKGIFKAVFMAGMPGSGKAQPLYSKIRTPSGWISMGDIDVGQEVVCPDGGTSKVTHVHPQGIKDIYTVTLNDGREIKCTLEHLWKIGGFACRAHKYKARYWRIENLEKIKERLSIERYKNRIFLPSSLPVESSSEKLYIDPYILGILLGDGSFRQRGRVKFTSDDSFIVEEVNKVSKYPLKNYKNDYFIGTGIGGFNLYKKELVKMGLWEKYSYEKFIPQEYKESSIEQRSLLVRGLMDSNGYVSKSGHVQYYTTSKRLADDFRYVIWSLGGNTFIREKGPEFIYKGERKKGRKTYTVSIFFRKPQELFSLPRKKERCKNLSMHENSNLKCRIKKVEYAGKYPAKCITIDHPEGLYLTDNFVVTHNSYTMDKIKSGQIDPRVVNTDKFKEFFGKWDKPAVDKSKRLTGSQLYLYLNSMLPLFVDGTSAWSGTLNRRYNILSEVGYDLAMVFVTVPIELAIQRAQSRKRKVPEEYVRESYKSLEKLKSVLKSKFKLFIEVNNDEGVLNNEMILKIYRKISFFYTSPVKNTKGKETIRLMRNNGWKYLVPNIYDRQELKSLANKWYKITSEGEDYEMKIKKFLQETMADDVKDVGDKKETNQASLIIEERLSSSDKNKIIKAIDAGKKTSFELGTYKKKYPEEGEADFEIVQASNKSLTVEFNLDFIDLQYWLQDYCDNQEWETTSGSERRTNIFWMKIKKV